MTDNSELLLDEFFQSARSQQIADDGFSRRVMQRVPRGNTRLLCRLWTWFCLAVGLLLFVWVKAWIPLAKALMVVLTTRPTQQGVLMFLVTVFVLGLLAVVEILQRERLTTF